MSRSRVRPFPSFAAAVAALGIALAAGPARAAAPQAKQASPASLGFTKSVVIEVANPTALRLDRYPLVLRVADVLAVAPDFNTYNFIVFDRRGGGYTSVSQQADDFDKDRYHDEIVLIADLAPSASTRLEAFYNPKGSFQMMMTAATDARVDAAASAVAWESALEGFRMAGGRITPIGKLIETLVVRKFPTGSRTTQDWGVNLTDPGTSAGLGGLTLGDGKTELPLRDTGEPGSVAAERSAPVSGPIRAMAQVRFTAAKAPGGEAAVLLRASAFAGNMASRQEITVTAKGGAAARLLCGPGLQKLPGGTWTIDEKKGYAATWGRGADAAGSVGLAAVFSPRDFAGVEETPQDHTIRLAAPSGRPVVHWIVSGWERGIGPTQAADAKAWEAKVAALAERLLAPVKVTLKAR